MTSWLCIPSERLGRVWETQRGRRWRSAVVVATLLGGILLIEARRLLEISGVELPEPLASIPTNHLHAIGWSMTALLISELIGLVLSLTSSVANTIGQQLEIYALILIRSAFEGLTTFAEPVRLEGHVDVTLAMSADAGGAIALLLVAAIYRRMQHHTPLTEDPAHQELFVTIKTVISSGMLALLGLLVLRSGWTLATTGEAAPVIAIFFTVLIFVDVLMALVSIGFTSNDAVVFRNFGFAFATVLLRLAITAPEYGRPLLGVAGGATAIAVTYVYNMTRSAERFGPARRGEPEAPGETDDRDEQDGRREST